MKCVRVVFQLPSSPKVHIIDMKNSGTPQDAKKRRLFESPAAIARAAGGARTPTCDVPYDGISLTPCAFTDDTENIENTSPALRRLMPLPSRKSPHSPVHITSDGRFERPTAFVSPISRTMAKAPKTVQVNSYTSPLIHRKYVQRGFLLHL